MTEYDFSPEAYEHAIANHKRVAKWVDNCNEHYDEFRNPFTYTRSDHDNDPGFAGNSAAHDWRPSQRHLDVRPMPHRRSSSVGSPSETVHQRAVAITSAPAQQAAFPAAGGGGGSLPGHVMVSGQHPYQYQYQYGYPQLQQPQPQQAKPGMLASLMNSLHINSPPSTPNNHHHHSSTRPPSPRWHLYPPSNKPSLLTRRRSKSHDPHNKSKSKHHHHHKSHNGSSTHHILVYPPSVQVPMQVPLSATYHHQHHGPPSIMLSPAPPSAAASHYPSMIPTPMTTSPVVSPTASGGSTYHAPMMAVGQPGSRIPYFYAAPVSAGAAPGAPIGGYPGQMGMGMGWTYVQQQPQSAGVYPSGGFGSPPMGAGAAAAYPSPPMSAGGGAGPHMSYAPTSGPVHPPMAAAPTMMTSADWLQQVKSH